jgi:squalene-associated FAD-dependent desaturase
MAGRAQSRRGALMSRVVVIGGGLAGITAALDCAAGGADVTLLESRGRLGGAAYTFERDGLSVDNGQHVFLRCCTNYLALVERLGATRHVELQPRLSIPVLAPGGRITWLTRDPVPAPLHLARSLLANRYLSALERVSVAVTMQLLKRVDPDDPAADARSFGDWLSQHRQTANAVEVIWELVAKPTLNLSVADTSLAQAAYVFQKGLLGDAASGDVGYTKVPLGEVHDVAARAALERAGVTVRLRAGAQRIDRDGEAFGVALSGQPAESADAVVVAVPPQRAKQILPPEAGLADSRLEALGSSPIVNLHIIYDRQVMGVDFAAAVYSPVQWIFDRTRASGLGSGQYIAMSLSAADEELERTATELRERFLPALARVLPAAAGASVENFFVTREHAATFRAAPGSRRLRPGPVTGVGGLSLAGAWTDTGWPATMEGAVASGHSAATETLGWLGARRAPQRVAA